MIYSNVNLKKVINLTPHSINVYSQDDCVETVTGNYKTLVLKEGVSPLITLPSEGVARAAATKQQTGTISLNGLEIPVNATVYGDVEGLPEPSQGTFYVVSALTAQAAKNRDDLIIVDSTVRDKDGRIVGCTAFGRI